MAVRDKSWGWRSCAVLCAFLPLAAQAEFPARTEVAAPQDIFAVSSLDELVVTGEREKITAARKALVEADDRFYEVFNAGNDNHDFDMLCHVEARTGTLIRQRVCTPRIVEEGTQAEAARLYLATEGNVMLTDPESIRANALVEMKKRMLERLKKDPELRRALLERAKLQQHYETLRKKKLDGRWAVGD